jgi:hypothetical protein
MQPASFGMLSDMNTHNEIRRRPTAMVVSCPHKEQRSGVRRSSLGFTFIKYCYINGVWRE